MKCEEVPPDLWEAAAAAVQCSALFSSAEIEHLCEHLRDHQGAHQCYCGHQRVEVVSPDILTINLTVPTPTIWSTVRFAPDWYEDALREAQTADYHARRREIIFAVCCAESYLLEWVRDDVLKRNFERLVVYFPPGKKRGLIEKWKEIPKKLKRDNLVPDVPNLSTPEWQGFRTLVEDFRDGLVHARSSRPEAQSQGPEANPRPTIGDLRQLAAGWAVKVVAAQIRALHQAAGTPAPAWVVDP